MARSVKKVRKQKSKKFWIILSSAIGALVVGLIIGLLVWYSVANTADVKNYFSEYTKNKINYNELENIIEDKKEEYDYKDMFVFVYDSSYQLDKPNAKENEPAYNTYLEYEEATKQLADLKSLIDKINEGKDKENTKVAFYVINGSLTSNNEIIANDSYESLSSPALLTFMDGYVNDDITNDKLTYVNSSVSVKATKSGSDEKAEFKSLSGGSSAAQLTYTIKNVMEYLQYTYGVAK